MKKPVGNKDNFTYFETSQSKCAVLYMYFLQAPV